MAGFNITRLSLNRPILPWIFFGMISLAGVFSYLFLNYELVPKFNPPVLTIVTVYPGAPAKEVEDNVSIPIENALSGLQGVETITSTSQDNFSLVRLEMKSSINVESALNEANRKLLLARRNLPEKVNEPVLSRFDFDDLPMMRLSIEAPLTVLDLSQLIEEKIIPVLTQVEGVAEIESHGLVKPKVSIELLPERLQLTNTTILQALQAIGKDNIQIPTGILESGKSLQPTLFSAHLGSIEEIKDLVIFEKEAHGLKVRMKDVADVSVDKIQPRTINKLNGNIAIGLDIKKQPDANAVNVSNSVKNGITQLEHQLRELGLKIDIAQDTSVFTLNAAKSVSEDLLLAVVLVSFVMLIFLHSLRNAVIVFFSIPISILSTFVVMYLLGYTLNLLSLLGLSLAIGILVDDSIVVIENIYRYLLMGKKPKEAAYTGRMEIGNAAVSITLIDVVVFLPLVFSSGMVADLLREFAVVIVTSTLMSLLVSFTLVPHLAARFHQHFSKPKMHSVFDRIDQVLESLSLRLVSVLKWSLNHKSVILVIIFLLIASTSALFFFGLIGIEFTKAGDRSEFILELKSNKENTLAETRFLAQDVESILLGYPEVVLVLTKVGSGSRGRITINDPSLAEMYVKLIDKSERRFSSAQFARHIKYRLMNEVPGLEVRPIDINIIGLRDDDAVQVTISGEDEKTINATARQLSGVLKKTPGAVEVQNSLETGLSTVIAEPIRSRMDLMDVDASIAAITFRTAIEGNKDFDLHLAPEVIPIHIQLKSDHVEGIEDLKKITVINEKGKLISFSDILHFEEKELYNRLERTNRNRSATVQSQVYGRPAGSVSRSFQANIASEPIDDSLTLTYGGATKRTRDGILSMAVALIISIFLVYAVLAVLYNSFGVPLVVLISLPLATIGAFFLLALTGEALSIFSIMGLIILAGLVGKNAILVVDVTRKYTNEGKEVKVALLEATRLRLRPILMTNLTMIFGLLPIALSAGAGSEWKNGLAWALIGGLSSSMLLSLIVVPVVYDWAIHLKKGLSLSSDYLKN